VSDEQQSIASRLPSGQRRAGLERFGHPHFAYRSPEVPERPVITITGEVRVPVQIPLDELLAAAPRREQRSDLHCVTTWSACDLVWSGAPMAALYDVLATQVRPRSGVRWLTVTGLDGARASLALDDALADDVLLADRLGGAPLTVDHGAPCRLVAPAHYGYKSIKGVCMIEFRRHYEAGASGWRVHPRGRVAREERSRYLPGWAWRYVWRAALPTARDIYRKAAARREK